MCAPSPAPIEAVLRVLRGASKPLAAAQVARVAGVPAVGARGLLINLEEQGLARSVPENHLSRCVWVATPDRGKPKPPRWGIYDTVKKRPYVQRGWVLRRDAELAHAWMLRPYPAASPWRSRLVVQEVSL